MGDSLSVAGVRASKSGPVRVAMLPRHEFLEMMKESPRAHEALSKLAQVRRQENRAHKESIL